MSKTREEQLAVKREREKIRYASNSDKIKARVKAYRDRTGYQKPLESTLKYRKENPEKARQFARTSYNNMRNRVINKYGGKCASCGESDVRILCIDHVDSNGNQERAIIRTTRLYWRLNKEERLDKYQVLCLNCNAFKEYVKIDHSPNPQSIRNLREKAVKFLGGACVICGDTNIGVLNIDHVHGFGKSKNLKHMGEK